jgi:hypothetical protein
LSRQVIRPPQDIPRAGAIPVEYSTEKRTSR